MDAVRKETQKRTRVLQLRVKREQISRDDTAATREAFDAQIVMCDFCGQRGHGPEECAKRRKMAAAAVRFQVPGAVLIKPEPT